MAYQYLRNYQQAIDDYTKDIELDPNYAMTYHYRGIVHNILGNYQQAIKDFNKVIELEETKRIIKLSPDNGWTYKYRGNAYYKLGKNQQAIKDLKIAARFGNKNAQEFLQEKGIQ